MTVAELIALLQTLPQDAPVEHVNNCMSYGCDITEIEVEFVDGCVRIDGK